MTNVVKKTFCVYHHYKGLFLFLLILPGNSVKFWVKIVEQNTENINNDLRFLSNYLKVIIMFFYRHVVDVRMNLRYRVSRRQRGSPARKTTETGRVVDGIVRSKVGRSPPLPIQPPAKTPRAFRAFKRSEHVYEASINFQAFFHYVLTTKNYRN